MTPAIQWTDLGALLSGARRVLVSGHVNPDGDSVGSALALYHILRAAGKEVVVYSIDPYPFNFLFLEGSSAVVHELPAEEPDLYLVVDAGSPRRVGPVLYERMATTTRPKVLLDHHVVHTDEHTFFTQAFIDPTAAATAVLVHRFATATGLTIPAPAARAIYAAVMDDTGGLRYNSANKEAFLLLSELVSYVEPWEVASAIWEHVPLAQLRLLGEVLGSVRILANGKAAIMEITLEQLSRYGLRPDNVENFVNYARSIDGVEVAMRFRETAPGAYKVSIRSRGAIDVSGIASEFGGGGHRNAAGFDFAGTFDDACRLVEEIVRRVS